MIKINSGCEGCPRLTLPLQAIAKGSELLRFGELVLEDAAEIRDMAHSADQTYFEDEDGTLISGGSAFGYHRRAENRKKEGMDITTGGQALIKLGETAISECQAACRGIFSVSEQNVCRGNGSNEAMRSLWADFSKGGLELSDKQPVRTVELLVKELRARENIDAQETYASSDTTPEDECDMVTCRIYGGSPTNCDRTCSHGVGWFA